MQRGFHGEQGTTQEDGGFEQRPRTVDQAFDFVGVVGRRGQLGIEHAGNGGTLGHGQFGDDQGGQAPADRAGRVGRQPGGQLQGVERWGAAALRFLQERIHCSQDGAVQRLGDRQPLPCRAGRGVGPCWAVGTPVGSRAGTPSPLSSRRPSSGMAAAMARRISAWVRARSVKGRTLGSCGAPGR